MNLTDTHAHLYWDSFKEDFDDMLKRALDAGVSTIINVGVDLEKSREALIQVQNLEKDPRWQKMKFFSTIGIHPHESIKYFSNTDVSIREDIEKLEQIYQSNVSKCIGVGECGLDYFFPSPVIPSTSAMLSVNVSEESLNSFQNKSGDSSPSAQNDRINARQVKILQRKLFQAQINLAKKMNLPLLVHCRDDRSKNPENSEAWDETIDMTKDHFGIYHCYSGLPETTARILRTTRFLISFAANITYPKNEYLREAAKIIPLERIVLETDSPFLAPQIKRGQRNELANVVEVAKSISDIKRISLEEVASKTSENVAKLFSLG